MTLRVEIHNPDATLTVATVETDGPAAQAVRFTFNPSGNARVTRIKSLAAALASELMAGRNEEPQGAREYSIAITNLQQASMWGVFAATTPVPVELPAEDPPAEQPPA